MSQPTSEREAQEFDPLAYIESAFTDEKPTLNGTAKAKEEIDVELPALGEFLGKEKKAKKQPGERKATRKRHLSSPRPRRAKQESVPEPAEAAVNSEMEDLWANLPKIVNFLHATYDDGVTANYYRGEFKESREELIQRLIDPELSLEEVSRLLGVCPATVRRYTNRGWLTHHRTKGGQRRFRLSGIAKFVDEHGRAPAE